MPVPTPSLAPTAPRERLGGLDLLRGFALCGILVINMRYFAMPMAKRMLNDPNHPGGEYAAADFWSWFGSSLLFEDKMMALFSVLFGAGIWLMRGRGLFLHYRRMFWLLLIGSVHAVLLWFGDILTLYALCGMVVVWFRRLPPSLLVVLGLSSVFFSIGERPLKSMIAESTPMEATAEAPAGEQGTEVLDEEEEPESEAEPLETPPAEEAAAQPEPDAESPPEGKTPAEPKGTAGAQPDLAPEPDAVPEAEAAEAPEEPAGILALRAELGRKRGEAFRAAFDADTEAGMHRGSWWGQVEWRARLFPWWQGAGFLLGGLFWNGGLMLLGMGLMGLGFLNGKLRAGTYLATGFAAMAFGLVFSGLGLWPQALEPLGRLASMRPQGPGDGAESFGRFMGLAYLVRSFGVFLVSFGWASLLLWLHRSGALRLLLHPLRAVGRMALTNYLTHTVVCIIVFEGWALGRWDEVRYFEQMQLVGAILLAQLIVCPLWLALFRFGPMEWLWRSMTYWKLQPMRKRSPQAGPPADAPPPSPPPATGLGADSPLEQTAG